MPEEELFDENKYVENVIVYDVFRKNYDCSKKNRRGLLDF